MINTVWKIELEVDVEMDVDKREVRLDEMKELKFGLQSFLFVVRISSSMVEEDVMESSSALFF